MENKENITTEEQEQNLFTRFLDRLHIFPRIPKFPIRKWMAWAGIIFFIAMVIVYYALGGGK